MFFRLLLLFTVVPLIELWLLLRLSAMTSLTFTIALVIGTGIVGSALARSQGFKIWGKIQSELAAGKPPTTSLVDGLMILIAGALLITPGVLTDLVGFSLLVPEIRAVLRNRLAAKLKARATVQFQMYQSMSPGHEQQHDTLGNEDNVIDAEFTRHPSDG